MNGDTLRGAGHVLGLIAHHPSIRDAAGDVTAGFTTTGFAGFAVLLIIAVLGRPDVVSRVGGVVTVGVAASFAAAGLGLLMKHVVAEPRPCQVHPALAEAVRCPASSNWSFPSNHAVLAGAFAATLVHVARSVGRLWIASVAMTLALAIAVSRVVLGVHYWWDVLAGLVLGATVAAVATTRVAPYVAGWIRATRERMRRRPSSVG